MVAAKMSIVGDKREIPDRRINDVPLNFNRRARPDRRINNILVEWIPINRIVSHPSSFRAYMKYSDRR